jgi:hypothetical protein
MCFFKISICHGWDCSQAALPPQVRHCDSHKSAQVFPSVYGTNMFNIILTKTWVIWIQSGILHRVSLSYPAFDNIVIFCKTRCSNLTLPLRFFDQNFVCNSYFHLACLLSILNTVLIFCCRLGMCQMIEAFYAINLPSAGIVIRNILNGRHVHIYYVELSTVGTCDMWEIF